MSATRPLARKEGLLLRELPDELLVYDLERHKASCLNQMAMLTWRRCDGRATVSEIAEALRAERQLPVDERAVWLALERLSRAHLFEEPVVLPRWAEGYSRRQWAAGVGKLSAGLVATVVSIVSPTLAAAQSVLTPLACEMLTTCATSPRCMGIMSPTVAAVCKKVAADGVCMCRPV